MQQMIATNDLRLRITKNRKSQPSFTSKFARHLRRINTDRHRNNPSSLEFREPPLHPSQLEGAIRSPITTIKNQKHRFRRNPRSRIHRTSSKQFSERDRPVAAIRQSKRRDRLPNLRRISRSRHGPRLIKSKSPACRENQRHQRHNRSKNPRRNPTRLSKKTLHSQPKENKRSQSQRQTQPRNGRLRRRPQKKEKVASHRRQSKHKRQPKRRIPASFPSLERHNPSLSDRAAELLSA